MINFSKNSSIINNLTFERYTFNENKYRIFLNYKY